MRTISRTAIAIFLFLVVIHLNAQMFVEVSAQAGIVYVPLASSYMGGGIAWFDYNGDGYDDLYVNGCLDMGKLFRNNQNGTFTDVTTEAGLSGTNDRNTVAVCSGDIDNDGDRDLFIAAWKFIGNSNFAPGFLFENNGDGTFTDISSTCGIDIPQYTQVCGFTDFNLDGYLDLYLGNYVETPSFITDENNNIIGFDHECFPDNLYISNGDNTFTDMAVSYGTDNLGCALAAVATDYDMDGDPDLMVANDFGDFIVPDRLYRNDYPDPHFTDVGALCGADISMYAMGIATGDYDEDRDLDYYQTNMGTNALINQEDGQFTDVAAGSGADNATADALLHTTWGTFFFDADNDSYLDLFVAAGHMPTVDFIANHVFDPNRLFHYEPGSGTFEDVAESAGVADTNIARGCAWADYDLDGDLDMAVLNLENNVQTGDEHFLLYRNEASISMNHWIAFTLEGTEANRDGFGSMVHVFAGGRELLREYSGLGGSHASQHGSLVHFGLGDLSAVDSVEVHWPGGGVQTLYSPEIEVIHHVVQGVTIGIGSVNQAGIPCRIFPNPVHSGGEIQIWSDGQRNEHVDVTIFDDSGKTTHQQGNTFDENGKVVCHIPPNLPPGVYAIRIRTSAGEGHGQLVVH